MRHEQSSRPARPTVSCLLHKQQDVDCRLPQVCIDTVWAAAAALVAKPSGQSCQCCARHCLPFCFLELAERLQSRRHWAAAAAFVAQAANAQALLAFATEEGVGNQVVYAQRLRS
jgi:hypothetical protein